MGYVLVLGANSDMGKFLAEKYAFEGYNLYLADTDVDTLEETKQYITNICDVDVQVKKFSVLDFYTHRNFYNELEKKPIGVIFAENYIGDQKRAQKDFLEAKKIIDKNYTGLISILNIITNDFMERMDGFVVVVGSIVGEHNKHALYTYSGAKQGFISHVEGLKTTLNKFNIQVIIALPGFVHTKETKDISEPQQLTSFPIDVAESVFKAHQSGKDSISEKKSMRQKLLSLVGKSS